MSTDQKAQSGADLRADLKQVSISEVAFDLFVVSFLLLFYELAVIRWTPAAVRVIAYFSNVVLVSCFLGCGVGCIYRSRRSLMTLFPITAVAQLLVCLHVGQQGVQNPKNVAEFIFYSGGAERYPWIIVIPIIFLLTSLPFIGIGHKISELFAQLPPLHGYGINLAGSLAGSAAFAALSFTASTPAVWFAASFCLSLVLLRRRLPYLLLGVVAGIAGVAVVHSAETPFLWSPYYKIYVSQFPMLRTPNYSITVNDDYHQLILGLGTPWPDRPHDFEGWRETYDFPYRFVDRSGPLDVLVLGAGSGNDVAAALRNGARTVDAVELDRVIVDIGRRLHPEQPYRDPRVKVFVTDARSFVESTQMTYDVIVLGWLDSHRLFSSLSNVRQDNFVYSVESMTRMKKLLKPDGALVLSFYAGQRWIGAKIFRMLNQAFGHAPYVYARKEGGYGLDGAMFTTFTEASRHPPLLGPDLKDRTADYRDAEDVPPPTDNWPYLYYRDRSISRDYLLNIVLLVAVSALMIGPGVRHSDLALREALHFFMLGAAFLLLEVRNITMLALVFGSTWIVTSIVISAILITALLANQLVARGTGRRQPRLVWACLFGSVLASLAWNVIAGQISSRPLRQALTTAIISLTFVFAGIIFSRSFSQTRSAGSAIGYNILGAVIGGFTEYASLLVGINGLSIIALSFYLIAWTRSPLTTAEAGTYQ